MSESMNPVSFKELLTRTLTEYEREGAIFGVRAFYKADKKGLPLFGGRIETPFGPAAGPHTQLSENLVAGYAAGARFFELKTVQKMDGKELAACIARPCIYSKDEAYNCEWSTELTVPQAFTEYVNAYVVIKIIAKRFGFGDPDGFLFNMSVGYDLAGIRGEKVNTFIDGMMDASGTDAFRTAIREAKELLPGMADYIGSIDPHIVKNATISTLHGCPPEEIESIARYLITEKHLHTLVKCNPTLLGYETARERLDKVGYDYVQFPDKHFKEDLQYSDAVAMFRRLMVLAEENGVEFGVKLSNTCPVDVKAGELPSEEMYMSGKSLYVLTTEMAARLSEEFEGKLRISYSGGADFWHLAPLCRAGIWPVTMATTLLKPGGYDRFFELADTVKDMPSKPFGGVNAKKIRALADSALTDTHIVKPVKVTERPRMQGVSPLTDCFDAPCEGACPVHQNVPAYLALLEKGEYEKALRVITEKNPLPFITGTICAHKCMNACTRLFYDTPVNIRGAKLECSKKGYDAFMKNPPAKKKAKKLSVAIAGAGPAGLAAAYYLGREGVQVTVFDKEEKAGGLIRTCLPAFRISGAAIDRDVRLVKTAGAKFVLGKPAPDTKELLEKFDYVILACGAQKSALLNIGGREYNAVAFLKALKAGTCGELGENVCVIGAGNTAMDAARAAKRVPGVKTVSIIYRRTKKYMPADAEEMELALSEGVSFLELLAPVRAENGMLLCEKMMLGLPDAGGRRSPVKTGETISLPCDTLISALGEQVDSAFLEKAGIPVDAKGRPALENGRVFVAGDMRRGPSTVVESMADAMEITARILGKERKTVLPAKAFAGEKAALLSKGVIDETSPEPERCLHCGEVCGNCVSACPNRANMLIRVPGLKQLQVLHVDRFCNECGNCAFFCPYESRPYKNKWTLFTTEADLNDSENEGFTVLDKDALLIKARLGGEVFTADLSKENPLPKELELFTLAVIRDYAYLL